MNNNKRIRIMRVAERLLATNGFEKTPVRKICNEAGVNIAMINYYFGSKRGLFEEIIQTKIDIRRDKIKSISDKTSNKVKSIEEVINYYVDSMFNNILLFKLMIREATNTDDTNSFICVVIRKEIEFLRNLLHLVKIDTNIDEELSIVTLFSTVIQFVTCPAVFAKYYGFNDINTMFKEPNLSEIKNRYKRHLVSLARKQIFSQSIL